MGDLGRDSYGQPEEDRLPWLEPVDEQPVEEGVSPGRLIAGLVVALIALGLVVGGVYWLKQRASAPQIAAAGDSGVIAPPTTPYKVKPAEPGGMKVAGQGDSSYAASAGAEVNGQIDLHATPETPIARTAPAKVAATPPPAAAPVAAPPAPKTPAPQVAAKVPAPAPAAAPKKVVASAPSAPAAGGTQVQLGAFGSEAKANAAWKSLSGRFSALSGLSQSVVSAEVNGKTVYRLRAAAGGKASEICAKLKVAGEACAVIG